jgi:ketosteroid isomerase-like protein
MSNYANLKSAIAQQEAGDPSGLMALFADDFTWAGWNLDGRQQVYSKPEFFEALGILGILDEHREKVVNIWPIGDDIVATEVAAFRRKGDHVFDGKMLAFYRFTDGKITHAGDACPPSFETFWNVARG